MIRCDKRRKNELKSSSRENVKIGRIAFEAALEAVLESVLASAMDSSIESLIKSLIKSVIESPTRFTLNSARLS